MPHPPQLAGSDVVLVHPLGQCVSFDGHWHMLETHVIPVEHGIPHPPQFALSVAVSVQVPVQHVPAVHAVPVAQHDSPIAPHAPASPPEELPLSLAASMLPDELPLELPEELPDEEPEELPDELPVSIVASALPEELPDEPPLELLSSVASALASSPLPCPPAVLLPLHPAEGAARAASAPTRIHVPKERTWLIFVVRRYAA